jgi:hypothetical protein
MPPNCHSDERSEEESVPGSTDSSPFGLGMTGFFRVLLGYRQLAHVENLLA